MAASSSSSSSTSTTMAKASTTDTTTTTTTATTGTPSQASTCKLHWRLVGDILTLKQTKCRHLFAEWGKNHDLALFYLLEKDQFYAMEAWCSHMGGPLFQGDIEDYKNCAHIRCPWHGYMFELENGKNEIGLMQEMFEVKEEEYQVYIKYKCELSIKPYR